MSIERVELVPGYLKMTDAFGRAHQIAIADVLRAVDIPDLKINSLTLLTNLARVVNIIIETMIENGSLPESYVEGYDIGYVKEVLEDDLKATY